MPDDLVRVILIGREACRCGDSMPSRLDRANGLAPVFYHGGFGDALALPAPNMGEQFRMDRNCRLLLGSLFLVVRFTAEAAGLGINIAPTDCRHQSRITDVSVTAASIEAHKGIAGNVPPLVFACPFAPHTICGPDEPCGLVAGSEKAFPGL